MDKKDVLKNTLEEILTFVNAKPNYSVEEKEDNTISISIDGNNLSFLIGYRGESLDALQTILGLTLARQFDESPRVIVDINNYRKQREEKIEQITKSFIDRVRFFGKEIEMPPMNPFERRVVHTFVASYDDIQSESTGEKYERRVVLKPKKK